MTMNVNNRSKLIKIIVLTTKKSICLSLKVIEIVFSFYLFGDANLLQIHFSELLFQFFR